VHWTSSPLPLVGGAVASSTDAGGLIRRLWRHLPQRGRQGRGLRAAEGLIRRLRRHLPQRGRQGGGLRAAGDLIRRLRRHLPQRGRQGRGLRAAGGPHPSPAATPSPEGKAGARQRRAGGRPMAAPTILPSGWCVFTCKYKRLVQFFCMSLFNYSLEMMMCGSASLSSHLRMVLRSPLGMATQPAVVPSST